MPDPGVWMWGRSSRAEDLLAVSCRVFMGLEEGNGKTADKSGGEIGIGCPHEQGFEEGKAGVFHRGKGTEPFLLVHAEELEPPAQLGKGDRKASAESLHGGKAQEILRQDTEEEEEAVAGVGDNEIREDGWVCPQEQMRRRMQRLWRTGEPPMKSTRERS